MYLHSPTWTTTASDNRWVGRNHTNWEKSGKCKLNFNRERKLKIIFSLRKLQLELFLRQTEEEQNRPLLFPCLRHYFFHTCIVWDCFPASISYWGCLLTRLTFRKLYLGEVNFLLCQTNIFEGVISNIWDISAKLFNLELMFLWILKTTAFPA